MYICFVLPLVEALECSNYEDSFEVRSCFSQIAGFLFNSKLSGGVESVVQMEKREI